MVPEQRALAVLFLQRQNETECFKATGGRSFSVQNNILPSFRPEHRRRHL